MADYAQFFNLLLWFRDTFVTSTISALFYGECCIFAIAEAGHIASTYMLGS